MKEGADVIWAPRLEAPTTKERRMMSKYLLVFVIIHTPEIQKRKAGNTRKCGTKRIIGIHY